MTRRIFIAPAIAAVLLTGCTKSDEVRARQKAHEAGQDIKEGLKDATKEAKEAGRKLKEELKDAGNEAKRGIEKGSAEVKRGLPDHEGDADRRKR